MKNSNVGYSVYVAHSTTLGGAFRIGTSKNTTLRVRDLSEGLLQPYRLMYQHQFASKSTARMVEFLVTQHLKSHGQHLRGCFYGGSLESIIHAIIDYSKTVVQTQPELQFESVNNPVITKIRGVDFHRGSGKWRARKRVQGLDVFLGNFDTKQEAQSAVVEFLNRLA